MSPSSPANDPLPSWNEGAVKISLIRFIEGVTGGSSTDYIPPGERIAVFDNDGTLCSEMPVLTQFAFTMDRVRAYASDHPEWTDTSPFREILAGDMAGTLASGRGAFNCVLAATYAGMTVEEFEDDVSRWMHTARHLLTSRKYTEMVYQPMIELLAHLKRNEFKTYIVSASGIDFLRPWTEAVYGIPPEQVIGSSIRVKYEDRDGVPALVRLPQIEIYDEGEEKPVAIHHFIGRRPILAFGDSDGDLPMLRWVASSSGARFTGLITHMDPVRERDTVANHPDLGVARCDRVLAEAKLRNWAIVDMRTDWKRVFPFE